MELQFVEEKIPTITKPGGSGREPEKWEQHLDTPRLEGNVGKEYRVFTYRDEKEDKKSAATSRMQTIRERLTKAVPHENWTIAVRPTPGADSLGTDEKTGRKLWNEYGIYFRYNGLFTDDQVAANFAKRQERSKNVREARAKAEAARQAEAEKSAASASGNGTPEPTAAEKVAAARTAKQKATA